MTRYLEFIVRFWQDNTTLCMVILGLVAIVILVYPIVICKTYGQMKGDIKRIEKEIREDKDEKLEY